MKTFLTLTSFLLTAIVGFSQCPTGSTIIFLTQEEVDDFAVQYPNCTELHSNIWIGEVNSDISNLDAFNNIITIGVPVGNANTLLIHDLPNLTSLEGLSNLVYVGGDVTLNNLGISNLEGLENLEEVRGDFHVAQNTNLNSLAGVSSLMSVGGLSISEDPNLINLTGLETLNSIESYAMTIQSNENLETLEGLNNVTKINGFFIISNPKLETLDALNNVDELGGIMLSSNESLVSIEGLSNVDPNSLWIQLNIANNINLSDCAVQVVCDNLYNPNIQYYAIFNNAQGCNSPEEIEEDCNLNVGDFDSNTISIFPNPVSENLQIQIKDYEYLGAEVYSVLGELVVASNKMQLDFSKLPSGVYFVTVETNGGFVTKKVVKE